MDKPPWERPNLAQVPRLGGSEPCLSEAERSALPSLWAARSNAATRTNTQRSGGSQYCNTPPPEDSSHQHTGSLTGTIHTSPQPYEVSFGTPPASRSQTSPPTNYSKELPATPPDSLSEAPCTLPGHTGSSTSKQAVKALPGTMSARNTRARTPSRARMRSSGSDRRGKGPTKMNRWKSAVREFFTKDAVDGAQFEKIEQRHWADD